MKQTEPTYEELLRRVHELEACVEKNQSCRYQELILDSISEPTSFVDKHYRYLYVNNAYCNNFGREKNEIIGLTVAELVGADNFEKKIKPHIDQCFSGKKVAYEFRGLFPGGVEKVLQMNYQPHYNTHGYIDGLISTAKDITSRKIAENELQESRKELRRQLNFTNTLLKNLPVPLFYKDAEGKYLGCNPAFEAFTGKKEHEIRNKTVEEVWNKNLASGYRSHDINLLKAGNHQKYEFKVTDSNNDIQDVIFDKAVFLDENNQPAGIIGVFLDITERKKAETALRESEEKYRLTVENSPDAILMFRNDKLVFASPVFHKIVGYTPKEVYNSSKESFFHLIHPEDREIIINQYHVSLKNKRHFEQYHYRIKKKDGTYIWINHYSNRKFDKNGNPEISVIIARDVTDKVQAEQKLRDSEEKHRHFVENSIDGILLTDEQGHIITWNKSLETLTGITEDLALKSKIWHIQYELSPPEMKNTAFYNVFMQKFREFYHKGQSEIVVRNKEAKIFTHNTEKTVLQSSFCIPTEKGYRLGGIFRDITQQKKNEHELLHAARIIQATYDSSIESFFLFSIDFTIMAFNKTAAEYARKYWGKELAKGQNMKTYAAPVKSWDIFRMNFNRALNGKTIENEHLLRGINDMELWFYSTFNPVFDEDNNVAAVSFSSIDITARKKAELALKKSEEKYRTLIENQGEGIGITNKDEVFTFANPAAEKIFGVKKNQLVGKSLKSFLSEKSWKKVQHETEIRKQRKKSTYELEIFRPDGKVIPILTTVNPQFDEYGNFCGAFGVFRDISEIKKSEQLLNQRIHYETSISQCLTTLLQEAPGNETKALRYILNSSGASRIYIFKNFHDQEVGLCMKQTHEVCIEGVKPEINNPVLQKVSYQHDGFARWKEKLSQNEFICGNINEFPSSEQEILKSQYIKSMLVIPIFIDKTWFGFIGFDYIHEEKTWDAADLSILLTVAEIFSIHFRRQQDKKLLIEHNKKLEKLNSTKDKLFSIIGHDLKNPLNIIIGFAELLNRGYDRYTEEKRKNYIQLITQSGKSLTELVEKLLTWSRTQREDIQVNPEYFDLSELVGDCFELFRSTAEKKQINLQSSLKIKTMVYADPEMIYTVIRNLLSNAIKFTGTGGTISIDSEKSGEKHLVSITDTGKGMDQKTSEKLFRVGLAQSTAGTDGEKGTGLGLIICKEFVEKNKGEIWVVSSPGKGSTFYFTLPVNK